jgi:hypothetical protein
MSILDNEIRVGSDNCILCAKPAMHTGELTSSVSSRSEQAMSCYITATLTWSLAVLGLDAYIITPQLVIIMTFPWNVGRNACREDFELGSSVIIYIIHRPPPQSRRDNAAPRFTKQYPLV